MESAQSTKSNSLSSFKCFLILFMLCSGLGTCVALLVLTSFVWVPLLFLNLPLLGVAYLVLRVTGLSTRLLHLYYSIYDFMFYRSESLRKTLWQVMYDLMVYLYPQCKWRCMNYGFAPLTNEGKSLELSLVDEYERFPLQMYQFTASCQQSVSSWKDKTVVEVGSGRGGGLEYIHRTMGAAHSYGIDFSENQVQFCQQSYGHIEGLSYAQGDSEHLDQVSLLHDVQADLVINVESSHCYGNFDAFLEQVSQLLRKGGRFSMVDFRAAEELPEFEASLLRHGMKLAEKTDITPNVVQALMLDEQRKISLIDNNVNFLLRGFFKKFSGVQGSRINQDFQERKCFYMAYVLIKQ